jgi:hypothetical protein
LAARRVRERLIFVSSLERKNKGVFIGQITYGLENKMKG